MLNPSETWGKKVDYFSMNISILLLSQDLIYSTNNVSSSKVTFNARDLCPQHPVVQVQGETWDAHDCRVKEKGRFFNSSPSLSVSGLGHSLH